MITVLEYATLSWHVYWPNKPLFGRKLNRFQLTKHDAKRKAKHGWYVITDIMPNIIPKNAFFQQLYVKFDHGKPLFSVIAFRGTDNVHNDIVDVEAWFSDFVGNGSFDKTPVYFSQAEFFYCDALRYVFDELGCRHLSFTGHSLGGAIAQMMPAIAQSPFMAVTFNSPGIGHFKNVNPAQATYVYGINSRYGAINKIGKPFGRLDYINVPNDEAAAKRMLDDYADMKGLLTAINETDNPFKKQLLYFLLDIESRIFIDRDLGALISQHTIKHVISTLHEKQYAKIADESFV